VKNHTGSCPSVKPAPQLQVGSATVRRWVKSGRLHAVQPAGERGLVRIPATELERLEAGDDK
jgi:excisionase family DNA binding protein